MQDKEKEILRFTAKLSFYFILIAILGFVVLCTPFILSIDGIDKYGLVGDTIGGILNPIVAIGAGLLTFMAFLIQYEANKQVQEQFKTQQFESQFYEMLRLHKENINEMKIVGYEPLIEKSIEKDVSGNILSETETTSVISRITESRKVFVTMCTELIACFELLQFYNFTWSLGYNDIDLLQLAYRFFFFGSKSEVISSDVISQSHVENFRLELNNIRTFHKDSIGVKNTFEGLNSKEIKLHIKYYPFSGHENRLGHYYRHLYSTVKYVVENEEKKLFDYNKSREYLKVLRSQMSNDEQLMLYYNYIIGFGKDWENKGFLTKYRMLHNLPISKVKYAPNPREHFKDFINAVNQGEASTGYGNLFEWGDH